MLRRHLFVVATVTLVFLVHQAVSDSCSKPNTPCDDCYDWCEDQKRLCDLNITILESSCKKSCGLCPPKDSACYTRGCEKTCHVGDNGTAICDCPAGYILNKDGYSCTDFNECSNGSPMCEGNVNGNICINTDGSYLCSTCPALNSDYFNYYQSEECCLLTKSKCGKVSSRGRVGINEFERKWSWTVSIYAKNVFCTGAIISSTWVVSAGHCILSADKEDLSKIVITLGSGALTQTLKVSKVVLHPYAHGFNNDIVLLKLADSVIIGGYISPICFPNGESPKVGDRCYVSGFGQDQSQIEVEQSILSFATCNSSSINENSTLCAGSNNPLHDACNVTSGSPLVCQRCENCDWFLAGITSFGPACGSANSFTFYTKAEHFEQWISDVSKEPVTKSYRTCSRAHWSNWSTWTDCSVKCVNGSQPSKGTQTQSRVCVGGQIGSIGCIGGFLRKRECVGLPQCGEFSAWTLWSACSVTCSSGNQTRTRSCPDNSICTADKYGEQTMQIKLCHMQYCTFDSWTNWGDCSATCGNGTQTRQRLCNAGLVQCLGESEKRRICQQKPCDECSGRVDTLDQCKTYVNLGYCEEPDLLCNLSCCREEALLAWSQWSGCSATCGRGIQTRTSSGNREIQEEKSCLQNSCPWNDWLSWESCSVSCGKGTRIRKRYCMGAENDCFGDNVEFEDCDKGNCPCVDAVDYSNTCQIYADNNSCKTYKNFMSSNCNRTCCLLKNNLPYRKCGNALPTSVCRAYQGYCTSSVVQYYCISMCGLCPYIG